MSSKTRKSMKGPSISDLASKLQLLEKINKSIEKAEAKLRPLFSQREQLEREITAIRQRTAPIQKLPPEVLTYIFRDVIRWDDEKVYNLSTANRDRVSIMLVCKYWRELSIGTTTLWNTIYLYIGKGPNDIMLWAQNQEKYIQYSLSRSGAAPLHIKIDLEMMGNAMFRGLDALQNSLGALVPPDGLDDWLAWLAQIPWAACPVMDTYHTVFADLISKLMGEDGTRMVQWRSLELSLPEEPVTAYTLLSAFDKAAPQLERLRLQTSFFISEIIPTYATSQFNPFPSLPKLSELELFGEPDLNIFKECPALQSLTIFTHSLSETWLSFDSLNHFPSLQVLKLLVASARDGPPVPFTGTVHLPNLQHLLMSGSIPSQILQAFRLSKLPKLTWDTGDIMAAGPSDSIPKANLFEVSEIVDFTPGASWTEEEEPDKKLVKKELLALLCQLSAAHTILVKEPIVETVLEVVNALRLKGNLLSLRKVVATDRSGGVSRSSHVVWDIESA